MTTFKGRVELFVLVEHYNDVRGSGFALLRAWLDSRLVRERQVDLGTIVRAYSPEQVAVLVLRKALHTLADRVEGDLGYPLDIFSILPNPVHTNRIEDYFGHAIHETIALLRRFEDVTFYQHSAAMLKAMAYRMEVGY